MKIKGIGIDIVEVGRFRKKPYTKDARFYERIFTPDEIAYCLKRTDPAQSFAARFAAKEAVIKSTGAFFKDLKAIEITSASSGAPGIAIKGEKKKTFLVSLSHTKNYASAAVICIT